MWSEIRDSIIEVILQIWFVKFAKKTGKKVKVFGVSAKFLQEYCTTDKDIVRAINRMPMDTFLMDDSGSTKKEKDGLGEMGDDDDFLDGAFDDFVLIEMDEVQAQLKKMNAKINEKANTQRSR